MEMDNLFVYIVCEGLVCVVDFIWEDYGSGGWWVWKLEKCWLEVWFVLGELMVVWCECF